MAFTVPDYLSIPADQLGHDTNVAVRVVGDMDALACDMAESIVEMIRGAAEDGRAATIIIPVGPVDQFPILAEMINEHRLDCRDVMFINMDEYLDDHHRWIAEDHPLSFRGFMNRRFYDLIDPQRAPKKQNRLFPDPRSPEHIAQRIQQRGGVDACFGGIGINGHLAFNEPPESVKDHSTEAFGALPTRVLELSRETRTINSVTVGGDTRIIPRYAVTVGMQEILASRKLRFYCNRPWQSAVVRRALHGPVTSAFPASLLRTHSDAELAIADYVAAPPQIGLR